MDTDHNRFDDESPSAHLREERSSYGGSMFGGANEGMRPQRATTGGEDAMPCPDKALDERLESTMFDEGGCLPRNFTESGKARRADSQMN